MIDINEIATLENARKWDAEQDQLIFCLDLLEASANAYEVDKRVEELEDRFEELLAAAH